MILIFSSESDLTTTRVVDWLIFFGKKYIIINELTKIYIEEIEISNFKFKIV